MVAGNQFTRDPDIAQDTASILKGGIVLNRRFWEPISITICRFGEVSSEFLTFGSNIGQYSKISVIAWSGWSPGHLPACTNFVWHCFFAALILCGVVFMRNLISVAFPDPRRSQKFQFFYGRFIQIRPFLRHVRSFILT
jgi:hypothetical protein